MKLFGTNERLCAMNYDVEDFILQRLEFIISHLLFVSYDILNEEIQCEKARLQSLKVEDVEVRL